MPALKFRDRFYSPPVARSLTSPTGILSFGAGAAAGIFAFGPIGALAGLLAYAVRVVLAVPGPGTGERIDPFGVGEPWRHFVQAALQARNRFGSALGTMRPGPLRDHLTEIGGRIDDGVDEVWRIARRGHLMAGARKQVDERSARWELDQLRARTAGQPDPSGTAARTAEALQSQIDTAARMDAVLEDTRSRLQLLDARLDESVTRAIELSVQADTPSQLGPLGQDVEGIVTEMEALRQALDDTGTDPASAGAFELPQLGAPGGSQALGTASPQTSPQTSPPPPPPPPPSDPEPGSQPAPGP
ncbi:MAG: hypothetical protein JWM05_1305 [Acidimicrobiales bacterium]|nr:hypothetical protein [Acidimicrobiales bacterium]